jgi:hypoxanthine phosphoribosyltransferase
MKKTIMYSWEHFEEDCRDIVNKLKKIKRKVKYVYGPPRGGCIFAVKLSHKLGAKYLISLNEKHIPKNTLIVDDVSDSGNTLLNLVKDKEYITATAFIKPRTKFIPDIHCRIIGNHVWIIYQWEV